MKIDFTNPPHFEIIKFLYQFKDDKKFYKLEDGLLKVESSEEKYRFLYTLRNNALISTDREIYNNNEGAFYAETFNHDEEIRARILPKGVEVLESFLNKN